MRRFHIPILVLGGVSTFVLYVILTQRSPFLIDVDENIILVDRTAIAFFLISLFLAVFACFSLIWYTVAHLIHPHISERAHTRKALKNGLAVAAGLDLTLLLQLTGTLNMVTGILLWLTIGTLLWALKQQPTL